MMMGCGQNNLPLYNNFPASFEIMKNHQIGIAGTYMTQDK